MLELLKAGQHEFNGIVFIERSQSLAHKVKRYTCLSEVKYPGALVINEDTGYYVVNKSQSVIFYSFTDTNRGIIFLATYESILMFYLENIVIELAIIRGVALDAPFSLPLYSWLASVVMQACSECRNVRVSIYISSIPSIQSKISV